MDYVFIEDLKVKGRQGATPEERQVEHFSIYGSKCGLTPIRQARARICVMRSTIALYGR
jgi:hypothetical protein